jgi:hypothetical protein
MISYSKHIYSKNINNRNQLKNDRKGKSSIGGYFRSRNFSYSMNSWHEGINYGWGKD